MTKLVSKLADALKRISLRCEEFKDSEDQWVACKDIADKALSEVTELSKVDETIEYVLDQILKEKTIYQADDDGILTPADVEKLGVTCIPKAVGSKGVQVINSPNWEEILTALIAVKALEVGGDLWRK